MGGANSFEPLDDELLEDDELLDESLDDEVVVVDGVLDDEPEELLDDEELPPLEELYRSVYQPPPLRMKAPPPEIWRLAVLLPQLGQVSRGAAVMRCSASQAWPQVEQAYS